MTTRQQSTSEKNKAVVRKLAEEFNRQSIEGFRNVYTPDLAYHGTGQFANSNRESFTQFVAAIFAAFPDGKMALDDLLCEGDKVTYRLTFRGTHKAELMGIPATNKAITVRSIGIARVSGDRIAEEWENMDEMGLMQQLGVIPAHS